MTLSLCRILQISALLTLAHPLYAAAERPLVGAIRWDAQVGDGFEYSEWENRYLSSPKYRDRVPFYAKINGDGSVDLDARDPSVMDKEIAFASAAGLDYWAFLTYDDAPGHWGVGLGLQLENYLRSPNKNKVGLAIILADQGNIGDDESQWNRWINRYLNYLREPSYQKVLDGRPLVYSFRYAGWEKGPRFLAQFLSACANAGLPRPYIVDLHWNNTLTAGADAMSSYANGIYLADPPPGTVLSYAEQMAYDQKKWEVRKANATPQIPIITTGWDGRPRLDANPVEDYKRFYNPVIETATPRQIGKSLENAIRFVKQNPQNCPANSVLLYGWNEFTEGGFICPVQEDAGGKERLDAIAKALREVEQANTVSPSPSSSNPPPNILFILADDLGYEDLGCFGNGFHETPHIDRIAAEGIKLTRHYSSAAVCSPTRASILTGNFPARLGVTTVYWEGQQERPQTPLVSPLDAYMDPNWTYLPSSLQKAGYTTGMFGKWHLEGVTPVQTGFQTVKQNYPNPPGEWFAENVHDQDEWKTRAITTDTIAFIKESAKQRKPFFAYVSHNLPHVPWATRSDLLAKYRQKMATGKDYQGPTYAGMMEELDQSVAALLDTLRELGLVDNTLVIFTSDNGPVGQAKTRLNRGKSFPFEGGIRVPFLARWPGKIKPGSESDAVVVSADYFRTFMAVAGVGRELPLGTVRDSENFLPVLLGEPKQSRAPIIFHFPLGRNYMGPWSAIIDGPHKYIHFWEGELTPHKARPQERQNRLFNLVRDERELNNLLDKHPETAARLRTQLINWLEKNKCQLPVVRPIP